MPSYKTHAKFNILLALPLLLLAIWGMLKPSQELLSIFAGSFIYATLFMNPDVDVADKIKLFSLRGILTLPFRLYSKFFSHRGISHSLLFGSLTRVLWLLAFVSLTLFLFSGPSITTYLTLYKPYVVTAFAALFIADILHVLLDKTCTK